MVKMSTSETLNEGSTHLGEKRNEISLAFLCSLSANNPHNGQTQHSLYHIRVHCMFFLLQISFSKCFFQYTSDFLTSKYFLFACSILCKGFIVTLAFLEKVAMQLQLPTHLNETRLFSDFSGLHLRHS